MVSVGVQCAPKQLQAQLSPSDVQAFFNRTKRTLEEGSQPKGWVGELRPNQILRLKLPLVDPKKNKKFIPLQSVGIIHFNISGANLIGFVVKLQSQM